MGTRNDSLFICLVYSSFIVILFSVHAQHCGWINFGIGMDIMTTINFCLSIHLDNSLVLLVMIHQLNY